MRSYRIYFLTEDHEVGQPSVIEAADDGDAIQRAKLLLDGHDLEVWDDKELLATILSKG